MTTMPFSQPSRLLLMRRILLNLFIAMTGAYGLSVTGFLLLRALVGERWGIVGFFNSYLHLLILPAVILLPICLLLRRRLLIVELAAPFLLFVITYGASYLPHAAASSDVLQLRLLTYNILADQKPLESVAAIIAKANADIVALQELNIEAADYLKTRFAEKYPYQALHPQSGTSGQGILSRFPIADDEYWQLFQAHQRIVFEFNGEQVTLFNTHPAIPHLSMRGFTSQDRQNEITDLLERASQVNGALIVLGDFNMPDFSEDYARVAARYQDAYRAVGWGMGLTFPEFSIVRPNLSFLPSLARLDYVFHNDSFIPLEARVWPESGGSDHRPLFAVLALKP